MASYIILFRYTEQGIRNIKDSSARIKEAKYTFESVGAEVKQFFSVMGRYDTVFIVEAPNDEAIAKATLTVSSQGNVRTETLRAFTGEELEKIVTSIK